MLSHSLISSLLSDSVIREDVDATKIVSRHIKLLHRYNEAKDATQVGAERLCLSSHSLMCRAPIDFDWQGESWCLLWVNVRVDTCAYT